MQSLRWAGLLGCILIAFGAHGQTVEKSSDFSSAEYSSSKSVETSPLLAVVASPEPIIKTQPNPSDVFASDAPSAIRRFVKEEVPAQRGNMKVWFSLAAAEHGAAFFDAWSTRLVVSRGGEELNPTLKPFANSGAMYPAAQAFPLAMDYLGLRLMRSNNRVVRRLWWVPQVASTIASVTAGVHNLGVQTYR